MKRPPFLLTPDQGDSQSIIQLFSMDIDKSEWSPAVHSPYTCTVLVASASSESASVFIA